MSFEVFDSPTELAQSAAEAIQTRLAEIQAADRVPSLVLTGGGIAGRVYEQFDPGELAWDAVDLYWGDERFVPADHPDANVRQARDAFLDHIGVDPRRIHAMPPHACDDSMGEAAERYAAQLPATFDLVLLGVGDDGHVASLFPGRPSLAVTDRDVIAEFESPKPPPHRLSLTFRALNRARAVWFLVSGADKAVAVDRARSGDSVQRTPAAGVQGTEETRWFVDRDAAGQA